MLVSIYDEKMSEYTITKETLVSDRSNVFIVCKRPYHLNMDYPKEFTSLQKAMEHIDNQKIKLERKG